MLKRVNVLRVDRRKIYYENMVLTAIDQLLWFV